MSGGTSGWTIMARLLVEPLDVADGGGFASVAPRPPIARRFPTGRPLCDHRSMPAEPEEAHRGRVLGWSIILLLGVLAVLFVLCLGQKYLD
jgi:hypothetical protein